MTTNIDEHYPSALTDLLVVGDTPRDGVISNLKEVRVKCTWVKRPVCLCTHPPLRLPCVCPSSGSFPCLFIRLSFCAHVWMSSSQLVWPSNLTCLPLTDWLWLSAFWPLPGVQLVKRSAIVAEEWKNERESWVGSRNEPDPNLPPFFTHPQFTILFTCNCLSASSFSLFILSSSSFLRCSSSSSFRLTSISIRLFENVFKKLYLDLI